MDNKYVLLLALDSLLLELDKEYEGFEKEKLDLIQSKVYEHYGLRVGSSQEETEEVRVRLIEDTKKHRNQIIEEL